MCNFALADPAPFEEKAREIGQLVVSNAVHPSSIMFHQSVLDKSAEEDCRLPSGQASLAVWN